MRKLKIISPGVVRIVESEMPVVASTTETLVKVKAVGLNRIDLLTIDGATKMNSGTETPGVEFCGEDVSTGRIVMGLVPSGAFAEYIVCPKDALVPSTLNLDTNHLAALPEALAVTQRALINFVKPGDERPILIHGGSSGIGSFLIQVAKKFSRNVVTTVGDESKKDFCRDFGVRHVLNYRTDQFDVYCQEMGGAYHIIDILGAQYFEKTVNSMGQGGTMVVMAVMNGTAGNLNLANLLMKNLHIEGMTLKDKSPSYKSELISNAMNFLGGDLNSGLIDTPIEMYKFEDYELAFDKMRQRLNMGKIILKF